MERIAETRPSWTCIDDDCRMTVRNLKRPLIPQPKGWVDGRCPTCHLKLMMAGERGPDGDRSEAVRHQLRLGKSSTKVAYATRTNVKKVRQIQADMVEAGEIEKPAYALRSEARSRAQETKERQDADLAVIREAGELAVKDFAAACGLRMSTAKARLRSLQRAGKAIQRERIPGEKGRRWRPAESLPIS